MASMTGAAGQPLLRARPGEETAAVTAAGVSLSELSVTVGTSGNQAKGKGKNKTSPAVRLVPAGGGQPAEPPARSQASIKRERKAGARADEVKQADRENRQKRQYCNEVKFAANYILKFPPDYYDSFKGMWDTPLTATLPDDHRFVPVAPGGSQSAEARRSAARARTAVVLQGSRDTSHSREEMAKIQVPGGHLLNSHDPDQDITGSVDKPRNVAIWINCSHLEQYAGRLHIPMDLFGGTEQQLEMWRSHFLIESEGVTRINWYRGLAWAFAHWPLPPLALGGGGQLTEATDPDLATVDPLNDTG